MSDLTLTIPNPLPQPRPKITTVGGHPHAYYPAEFKAYQMEARILAQTCIRRAGLEMAARGTPVSVRMLFAFEPPASWSEKKKLRAASGFVPHVVKPDADNLVKALLDAFTGTLWEDDSQVVRVEAIKFYGSPCRADVEVTW